MSSQFSLSGAIPQSKPTNPFANIGQGNFSGQLGSIPKQSVNPRLITSLTGPTNQGILQTAKPSTPVKSVTDNQGNTVTYHAPVTPKPEASTSSTTAPESKIGTGIHNDNAQAQQQANQAIQDKQNSFPGLISRQTSVAEGNIPIGEKAANIATDYGKQISQVGQTAGLLGGGYKSTGTTPIGTGAASVVAQTAAQQQQALAQGEQAALAGTSQEMIAQNQAQQGLGTAAGLIQPQLGTYGQTYYQPTQAGQIGQGGDIAQVIEQYATGLANNTLSTADIPTSITGNAVLNAQLQKLAQQKNPAYNPTQQGAQAGSISNLTTQASTLQSVANGAEANYQLLLNTAQQGGVNQTNVPVINQLTQNIQKGLTSKEAVINFQSTLATVRSQYASILGGGTTTVDSQNRAQQAIPDDIYLGALQSLGVQLKNEAQNRIAGINQQITSLQGSQNTQNATSNIFSW